MLAGLDIAASSHRNMLFARRERPRSSPFDSGSEEAVSPAGFEAAAGDPVRVPRRDLPEDRSGTGASLFLNSSPASGIPPADPAAWSRRTEGPWRGSL
jgi:hypothetical protein